MPTFAAHEQPTRDELERCVRDAWASYHAALRDLTGREYEDAEAHAWDRLQRRLAELGGPFG
jgi:N-formylglutamate amidohydrolase